MEQLKYFWFENSLYERINTEEEYADFVTLYKPYYDDGFSGSGIYQLEYDGYSRQLCKSSPEELDKIKDYFYSIIELIDAEESSDF